MILPRDQEKTDEATMNTTTTFNQFRITTLGGRSNFGLAQNSASEGCQIGVDEMVWDSSSGTIATFQDSPSLISLLNGNRGDSIACSFVA
jgi:hypothetical protein